MNNCISKKDTKAVYKDGNTVRKVFAPDYSKTDVLYEALNTARVEDTGLDIPKILSVSVEDGQWVITSEYAKGVTLTQLIKEHPENIDSYVHAMVDYQIAFNKRSNPLLLKLKDKLVRQINELELDSNIKYELSTRLESLPKHNKLCHGDFNPRNIILQDDGTAYILDWSHATQGNASADAARTYLLFWLDGDISGAESYLSLFCKKSDTARHQPLWAGALKNPAGYRHHQRLG